jgi:restriction system protein
MAEKWHVYEEQAGTFFRSLGLSAEVGKLVAGARAAHKIDVTVEFERWGLRHLWIVECKQHQRPIEKADVETLKSIASDVGASVALLLAESGFQPGAIAAARSTNVVLSSLTSLRERAADEVLAEALAGLEARIGELA